MRVSVVTAASRPAASKDSSASRINARIRLKPDCAFFIGKTPKFRPSTKHLTAIQVFGYKTNLMLTEKQQAMLHFMTASVAEHQYPPSVREIGKRFGIYPATVQDHISAI